MTGLWTLVRWELAKLARRKSSYIGFALCVLLCFIVLVGFALSKWRGLRRYSLALGSDPVELINGPFFANFVVTVGFFALMPLLTATLAGNQLAGEARDGSLRGLLMRPVGRGRLFLAKTIATVVWVQVTLLFLLATAWLLGMLIYGGDRWLVFVWELRKHGPWIVDMTTAVWTIGLCTLGCGVALILVASVGMLLSALTDTPTVAHVGATGLFLISSVLQRLPDDLVSADLRALLPTSHMNFWQEFYKLAHPTLAVDWGYVGQELGWCLGLATVCLIGGAVAFRRRDVVS